MPESSVFSWLNLLGPAMYRLIEFLLSSGYRKRAVLRQASTSHSVLYGPPLNLQPTHLESAFHWKQCPLLDSRFRSGRHRLE